MFIDWGSMASGDKKLVKSKSGLRMVTVRDEFRSPFIINEPPWIDDKECSSCISCKVAFDFFQRRHHCRRCGKCFCRTCCSEKVLLPRMCFIDPVLHCSACSLITKKENEFFDTQIKTLLQGAQLKMNSSSFDGEQSGNVSTSVLCKLSSDQRNLLFELLEPNPFLSLEPIDIKKMKATKFVTSPNMFTGTMSITGVELQFVDSLLQTQTIHLNLTDKGNQDKALAWLNALQKAFRLVNLDAKDLSFSVLE